MSRTCVCTHKSSNGSQKLRLHSLSLSEPASNQNRVVGDLVWDLVSEASEGRGSSDERARVERGSHRKPVGASGTISL